MSDSLKERLETLRVLSSRLNAKCDGVAAMMKNVREFLSSVGAGVSAHVDLDSCGDYNRLAWGRHQGQYRILLQHDSDDAVTSTPWEECSRPVKLSSFARLPDLIAAIVAEAERLDGMADAAAVTAGRLVEAYPPLMSMNYKSVNT